MTELPAPLPESGSSPDPVAEALRYLWLALACLDEADEVNAPPHVQMAIGVLEGRDGYETSAMPGAFRF